MKAHDHQYHCHDRQHENGHHRTPPHQHSTSARQRSRSGERHTQTQAPRPAQQTKGQVDLAHAGHHDQNGARKDYWGGGNTSVNMDNNGYKYSDGHHVMTNPSEIPSSLLVDRPFTSKIDRLIEGEKQAHGEFAKPTHHKSTGSSSPPFPLAAPVQSSTLRSEISTDSGPTSKTEFRPLLPDPSPHSSGHSGEVQNGGLSNQNGRVEFKEPLSTRIPNDVSEEEFMRRYTRLKPDDRKKELYAQRQALLEEQRSLKVVLNQQEHLLQAKKEQLRKQQEIQKQRLQYFEQNGQFPPHSFNQQLGEAEMQPVVSRDMPSGQSEHVENVGGQSEVAMHPPSFPPQQQLPPPLPPHPAYSHQWEAHPSIPQPHPYPPVGPHQIGPPLPPPPPATVLYMAPGPQYMPQPMPGYPADPRYIGLPPTPVPAPHASLTEQDMVIESLRNMDLDRRQHLNHMQHGGFQLSQIIMFN